MIEEMGEEAGGVKKGRGETLSLHLEGGFMIEEMGEEVG